MSSACSALVTSRRASGGTPARSHRAGSSIQRFGRYSRASTGTCRRPSLNTPNTATWQLSTLPSRPDHCRATPTERLPCLAKLLSSMIRLLSDRPAEQCVRVPADLRDDRLMLPGRVADEVLKLLRTAAFNHLRHPGKPAVPSLGQALQVSPRHWRIVPRSRAKEPAVAPQQRSKCLGHAFDGRSVQPASENAVTSRSALVISRSTSSRFVGGCPSIRCSGRMSSRISPAASPRRNQSHSAI